MVNICGCNDILTLADALGRERPLREPEIAIVERAVQRSRELPLRPIWSVHEDRALLKADRQRIPKPLIAARIGRSVDSVKSRLRVIKKRDVAMRAPRGRERAKCEVW
jgi:hypothetical protein